VDKGGRPRTQLLQVLHELQAAVPRGAPAVTAVGHGVGFSPGAGGVEGAVGAGGWASGSFCGARFESRLAGL